MYAVNATRPVSEAAVEAPRSLYVDCKQRVVSKLVTRLIRKDKAMLKNPITARISFRCSAITRIGVVATLLGFTAYEYGARGQSDGPDAVATITSGTAVWGCVGGTQAYSTGGGVCNLGDAALPGSWNPTLPPTNHPMWT